MALTSLAAHPHGGCTQRTYGPSRRRSLLLRSSPGVPPRAVRPTAASARYGNYKGSAAFREALAREMSALMDVDVKPSLLAATSGAGAALEVSAKRGRHVGGTLALTVGWHAAASLQRQHPRPLPLTRFSALAARRASLCPPPAVPGAHLLACLASLARTRHIQMLFWCLCEPGDGVIVPAPFYPAFINDMCVRAGCVPVPAPTLDVDLASGSVGCGVPRPSLVRLTESALTRAYDEGVRRTGRPPKVLLLCNPHNPLGCCLSRAGGVAGAPQTIDAPFCFLALRRCRGPCVVCLVTGCDPLVTLEHGAAFSAHSCVRRSTGCPQSQLFACDLGPDH